jgi:hypothetical protein
MLCLPMLNFKYAHHPMFLKTKLKMENIHIAKNIINKKIIIIMPVIIYKIYDIKNHFAYYYISRRDF